MLVAQLVALGYPEPEPEYAAVPGRRYRWDFAYRATGHWPMGGGQWPGLLIEIQGQTWVPGGAHSGGTGLRRDCEKACEAAIAGWLCLPVTTQQVEDGTAAQLIARAIEACLERR